MNPISTNNNTNSNYYQGTSNDKQEIFEKLTEHYELTNPDEIYDFIKLDIDLLNELDQILPLLNKYFPTKKFYLKFVPDYEFEDLDQLVVYICTDNENFEEDWKILNELNSQLWLKIDVDVCGKDEIF